MKNMIIASNGSVQNIPSIPDDIKAIYKTVWEISQKRVLDLAADRGAFICQSQSLNVHLQSPTMGQLTSMHFYGWKRGLKTGMYYLRTRPAAQAIQFTVDAKHQKQAKDAKAAAGAGSTPTPKKAPNGVPTPDKSHEHLAPSAPSASPTATIPLAVGATTPAPTVAKPVAPTTLVETAPAPAPAPMASTAIPATPATPSSGAPGASWKDGLDEKTLKAAEADPEFASALQRKHEKELEQAKLMCSLENKEACVMCSG